jgi:hypothetical protein
MSKIYHIRLLKSEDWTQFKTLRLEALTQHPESFGASFEEECKSTDEAFQLGFKNSEIFGAFIKNNIVSCAGFFIYSSLKTQHRGCLFSMYTRSDPCCLDHDLKKI